MKANRSKVKASEAGHEHAPGWRHRAVSKSLTAARTRAEQRVQGLLDAAFELIDERGTTQFTIQEVVDRSKQSLRGFYQYFDGKDELLFALLEENIRESIEDLRETIESEAKPLERLRAFTIRLHEWCEPLGTQRKRGAHNRLPLSEFSLQLALKDPDRRRAVKGARERVRGERLGRALAPEPAQVPRRRHGALLLQPAVGYSGHMTLLCGSPGVGVLADDAGDVCRPGVR